MSASAVRTFSSISAVAFAAIALVGCFDLSDPSGPRREDFARDKSPTQVDQGDDQDDTQAEAPCESPACDDGTGASAVAYGFDPDGGAGDAWQRIRLVTEKAR